MDSRQRIDEGYKRKLHRIKVRSFENPFQYTNAGKSSKWKFQPLKLFLIIIVIGAFFTFISSPNGGNQTATSHTVSQWIWGGPDPRYESDLHINWEEISITLGKLSQNNKLIKRIGLLNFDHDEIRNWEERFPDANHTILPIEYAHKNLTWDLIFPEWIDDEEELELPKCPSLPAIQIPEQVPDARPRLDLIAVKLPCKGDNLKDVARLHLQLGAANLAAAHKGNYPVHVLFVTSLFPIPNLFTCKDLIAREGTTWLYKPDLFALREKVRLPIGSCELALPHGGIAKNQPVKIHQREAYATVIHSTTYVCGAIAAAQSIRKSGSTADLIILVDKSIPDHHRSGLESAGWQVRTIDRIRNPKAEKDSYNEWNYSKFRLWQLTDYDKIIFLDADVLILKNIDFLFQMPEISAAGNHESLFNSGVMVIEPSNCTFKLLMDRVGEIESYNGGDQGYLNEIFSWWHRIPEEMNFKKFTWVGDDEVVKEKKRVIFAADPAASEAAAVYVLHYFGNKPWLCFRDYDCNWNVGKLHEFASDVAHGTWWRMHDTMPVKLQEYCLLRTKQKAELERDRREAEKGNFSDGHWRMKIKDSRLQRCIQKDCDWERMLSHFYENTPKPNTTLNSHHHHHL